MVSDAMFTLGRESANQPPLAFYTDLGLFTANPGVGAGGWKGLQSSDRGSANFRGQKKIIGGVAQSPSENDGTDRMGSRARTERFACAHHCKTMPRSTRASFNPFIEASRAGVEIDLIIRGICCLKPGVKGLVSGFGFGALWIGFSNTVGSFYFENGCRPEVFVGSADWMPRNFFKRIEVVFPVEDGVLRDRITEEILSYQLKDNQKARTLASDGSYHPEKTMGEEDVFRSQGAFMKRRIRPSGSSRKASSSKLHMQVRSKTFSFMKCQDPKTLPKGNSSRPVWGPPWLVSAPWTEVPARSFRRIDSFADSGSPSTHSLLWSKQPATHAASRGHGCRFDGVASTESITDWRLGVVPTKRFIDFPRFTRTGLCFLPMRCRTSRWPVRRLSGISSWVLVALGNRSLN